MIVIIIFITSLLLLLYSYFLYPLILLIIGKWNTDNSYFFSIYEDLPTVSIIISAYNEELHIEKRIRNIISTTYPITKLEILVGSDGSNDKTPEILKTLQQEIPFLHCYIFEKREGKSNVLNQIVPLSTGNIIIFTDAKVLFKEDTIYHLVKNFKNSNLGCVGANIVSRNHNEPGSSNPENRYMSIEMQNKYYEGKIWGSTIGVFGACYAIPRENFSAIPKNFSVDDFYISMKILSGKKRSILDLKAICYEKVPDLLVEEFRRKIRISVGNFQNLMVFKNLLSRFSAISFCFFSHKVIRWFGPFLLIMLFISNFILFNTHSVFTYLFFIQLFTYIIPIIDFFLHKIQSDILILRFVTHFYAMNLALLIGFIKFLKGVNTNVWEPTKRK